VGTITCVAIYIKVDKPITTRLRLEDGSEGGIGMSSYASD
jgi:hypothetical protein